MHALDWFILGGFLAAVIIAQMRRIPRRERRAAGLVLAAGAVALVLILGVGL
jgi:hypothetical protein